MIALPEGSIFAQRYRVLGLLGQGGMGAVYEVVHLETERHRALKVMHPNMIDNEDMKVRFRKEAKVAAQVDSEHIVDVFDAGVDDGTNMPFLVMELLRGEEIKKRLKTQGPFSPQEVVLYLYQTALALDKTHRANIIHRDLKPENLFLTYREDGRPHVKVLDFGVAKFVTDGGSQANTTRSLGTPLYMAPEQFRMDSTVCPQTDVYALGLIAYTLLVGVSYWAEEASRGANIYAMSALMGLGPPEAASARAFRRGVSLPPTFDAWFAVATAHHPSHRFPAATTAVIALADALGLPRPGQDAGGFGAIQQANMTNSGAPLGLTSSAAISGPGSSGDHGHATGAPLTSSSVSSQGSKNTIAIAVASIFTIGIGIGIFIVVSASNQAPSSAPSSALPASAEVPAAAPTALPVETSVVVAPSEPLPVAPIPTTIASAAPATKSAKTPPTQATAPIKSTPRPDLFVRD